MTPTKEQLNGAVIALLDAEQAAAKWTNPSYTPEAQQAKRAEMVASAHASLARLLPDAHAHAAHSRAALSDALDASLTSTEDTGRVMAREAVWARLRDRLVAGETLERVVRSSRSPIELESLANIAPTELSRLNLAGVQRTAEEWDAEVRQTVNSRYLELRETAGQFVELREQAASTDVVSAWADLGTALVDGKRGADVGGAIYTRLLHADDSAVPVYDLLMGR